MTARPPLRCPAPLDPASHAPSKIFVRLPSWVGDVVMSTPALRALREGHPGAELVVEGRPHVRELVMGTGHADRFLPDPGRRPRDLLRRGRALAREGFDWAVLLGESERAAVPAFLGRIPVRAGFARGLLRRSLLTHALPRPLGPDGRPLAFSMIERYLRVTRALGVEDAGTRMDVVVSGSSRERVDGRLAEAGLTPDEGFVVVVAGAAFGSSKAWPPAHFAAACDRLHGRHGWRAVLAPGPGEEALAAEVAALASHDAIVLADPVLDLSELAALLERAQLVVSNDTGPRSIAVALGLPVVVAVGPVDDAHTRHHLERQRVLMADVHCRPCNHPVCPTDHRCMTRITPEALVEAAEDLLNRQGAGQVRP